MTELEEIQKLKQRIQELEDTNKRYEENGPAKLYFSLNRKSWEMADLMNNINLRTLDIDDPKSKTFDRLKVVWQDASSIAAAVKMLGDIAGITGDENKDISRKPFNDRIAESRS